MKIPCQYPTQTLLSVSVKFPNIFHSRRYSPWLAHLDVQTGYKIDIPYMDWIRVKEGGARMFWFAR